MKKVVKVLEICLGVLALLVVVCYIFRDDIANYMRSQLDVVFEKPIIYLYPEEETEISVKFGNPEKLTVSYPYYTDGWKVLARPDGRLTDTGTGRELYALYYEADSAKMFHVGSDGFVIEGRRKH